MPQIQIERQNYFVHEVQAGSFIQVNGEKSVVCVLVTYNSEEFIEACISSLDGCDILVVDNNSSDSTRELVAKDPRVRLLHVSRNMGLAKAFNIGWMSVKHDYIALLNPDVLADKKGIESLVAHAGESNNATIAVPMLLNSDGTVQHSVRSFPTLTTGIARRTVLSRTPWGRRQIGGHLVGTSTDTSTVGPVVVDWALGAALVVSRRILEELEGYDESYFLYCEDVDFCARATLRGYDVSYFPSVSFTHLYQTQSRRTFNLRSAATRAHLASTIRLALSYPRQYFLGRPLRRCSKVGGFRE